MKRPVTPFLPIVDAFGPKRSETLGTVELEEPRPVDLVVYGLTLAQAYALAELCKRIGWSDVRNLAASDDEARLMIAATDRLRGALEQEGVSVR